MPFRFSRSVVNTQESLRRVLDELVLSLQQGIPPEQLNPIKLALSEIFANATRHGRKADDTPGMVVIEVTLDKEEFSASVEDQGSGFDWERITKIDPRGDSTKEHGRGLYLIRGNVSEVSFNPSGNRITIKKRLG